MKNTKHTENLDNSTPQEITSQSKRKILTSIGVSSGIIGASALSQQWTKPIVNSIILPAHAQSTPMMTTMAMGTTDMMGMPDPTTTMMMPDPTTTAPMPDPTTTMAPTDPPAPMPMIMLDAFHAQDFDGGVVMAEAAGTVRVTLSVMPTEPVTVTLVGAAAVGGGDALMFDNVSYDKAQVITITAGGQPDDMDSEKEAMVTLTAKGGNYEDVKAELTYTVGYYGADPVSNVKVMVTDSTADGEAKVTWDKPDTRKEIKEYRVTVTGLAADPKVAVSGEMADITEMKAGTAEVTVSVIYADDMIVEPNAPARADKPVV